MIEALATVAVGKRYKRRHVVSNVSLHIKRGEIVGLLGPNGAGKTTVFYMLAGLVRPDSGKVILNDRDVTGTSISYRAAAGVGYLPQEASVFRRMTVTDNILAVLELCEPDIDKRRHRCKVLLDEFQLQEVRDTLGSGLSGGERRRVEIARALARSPHFLLLDEPFAGVDPISITEIQAMIQQLTLSHNIGICITDHNVRETLGICQRAYIMNRGAVLTEGTPTDVLAHPRVRSEYLGEQFSFPSL